jgi:hypothetical protein
MVPTQSPEPVPHQPDGVTLPQCSSDLQRPTIAPSIINKIEKLIKNEFGFATFVTRDRAVHLVRGKEGYEIQADWSSGSLKDNSLRLIIGTCGTIRSSSARDGQNAPISDLQPLLRSVLSDVAKPETEWLPRK